MRVEQAERWKAAAVPWWIPRIVLVAGWLAAVVAGVETGSVCTPSTPCGPDVVISAGTALLLATPLLLATVPFVGCVAGAAFAVVDLAIDDLWAANVAFGLHGLACVAVAVWLRRARAAQMDIAGGTLRQLPAGEERRGRVPWIAAVLVVMGFAAFVQYGNASDEIAAHVAVATRVDARVTDVRDGLIVLDVGELSVLGTYQIGQNVPVLVDGAWVQLVAEPEDVSWWVTLGVLALGAAGLVLVRSWQTRAARQRSLVPAVEMRLMGGVLCTLDGRQEPVAVLRGTAGSASEPEYEDAAHFVRVWRGEEEPPSVPEPALVTVFGEFRYGGTVVLVADGIEPTEGRLRPLRRKDQAGHGGPLLVGEPVEPRAQHVELPVDVPHTHRGRMVGLAAGAFAVVALVAPLLGLSWGLALLAGGQCALLARVQLVPQVRLEHSGFVLHTMFLSYRVPWSELHGVRRLDDRLALAVGPDAYVFTTGALGLERAGELMMHLRERALAAGDPRLSVIGRPNIGGVVLGGYMALALAVLFLAG